MIHGELVPSLPDRLVLAAVVLIVGVALGWVVGRVNRRVLKGAGVPEAVEGTAFERTAGSFGTSTVAIIAGLSTWFVIGVSVLAALSVAEVNFTARFWSRVTSFLPELFVAAFVLVVGIVAGDKVELVIGERLRGIKLPQITVLPRLVKYSVVYIAALIALGQIGVATTALVVLLAAYAFALVAFALVAFGDLLRSGAAGMYLLLNQPYGIGDEVRIGGERGIVQEVTVFVTRIEDDDAEYVVPNRRVFEEGVARIRRE